ncbi:MAG: hypothetical protein RLZZ623_602 [Actinomycetota bacterium]|jgi:fructose transport system permease protein
MTDVATAHAEFERPEGLLARLQGQLHSRALLGPLLVLLLSITAFSIIADNFFELSNFSLMLQQIMVFAILGVGQTLVILTSGVDLSVGATMTFSMMVMAKMSAEGHNSALALSAGFLLGLLGGLINGFFITKMRLQPFIVTLATLYVFKSLSLWYSESASVRLDDIAAAVKWTGKTFTLFDTKLPYGVVMMLVLFAIMSYSLRHTAWGRHVYAVGDDREAARLAGIRVNRVLVSVYAITGLLCALAGWVLIGRSGGDPQAVTKDYNLLSIVFVVIGGTSLFGGRGRVVGTLLGALTYQVFYIGLPLAGVDDIWRDFAVGILILAAVTIDMWVRRVSK